MKWWGWALAGGLVLWVMKTLGKTATVPGTIPGLPGWMPDSDRPIETDTGQKVEVVDEGMKVEYADYINLEPFQIFWSDPFLQEAYDRENSYAARVGASDERIYREVQGKLRQVGKLTRDGKYFPVNSPYPLNIEALAYEEQRAPYYR